ncbi:MAG: DUF5995 family protein [Halobacteriales archaeon]|nr:DUF5995 family protein [Halobacteriales archaeon]
MGVTTARRLLGSMPLRAFRYRPDKRWYQPPDHTPQTALIELLTEPFESTADVTRRFDQLARSLRADNDGRAVFLSVYRRITDGIEREIEADRFADPAWVSAYLVAFADRYRTAFLAYERGNFDAVPDPWLVAFTAALTEGTLAIQRASLGINAHVTYDLAFAIDDVGIDPKRPQKYADHDRINTVLNTMVDRVQSGLIELYAPGLATIDSALGHIDESGYMMAVRNGRELAWRSAVAMTEWPFAGPIIDRLLSRLAVGVAGMILTPAMEESVLETLREIERDSDPLDQIDAVLEAQPPG